MELGGAGVVRATHPATSPENQTNNNTLWLRAENRSCCNHAGVFVTHLEHSLKLDLDFCLQVFFFLAQMESTAGDVSVRSCLHLTKTMTITAWFYVRLCTSTCLAADKSVALRRKKRRDQKRQRHAVVTLAATPRKTPGSYRTPAPFHHTYLVLLLHLQGFSFCQAARLTDWGGQAALLKVNKKEQ